MKIKLCNVRPEQVEAFSAWEREISCGGSRNPLRLSSRTGAMLRLGTIEKRFILTSTCIHETSSSNA
jgi:hypothetical protein